MQLESWIRFVQFHTMKLWLSLKLEWNDTNICAQTCWWCYNIQVGADLKEFNVKVGLQVTAPAAAQPQAGAQRLAKSRHCPGPPGLGTASNSVTLLIQWTTSPSQLGMAWQKQCKPTFSVRVTGSPETVTQNQSQCHQLSRQAGQDSWSQQWQCQ